MADIEIDTTTAISAPVEAALVKYMLDLLFVTRNIFVPVRGYRLSSSGEPVPIFLREGKEEEKGVPGCIANAVAMASSSA